MMQLVGPPPTRGDYFTFEWELGVPPVSRVPYRLAPAEMTQLKKTVDGTTDKVFIRPSTSPWRACTEDGFLYVMEIMSL